MTYPLPRRPAHPPGRFSFPLITYDKIFITYDRGIEAFCETVNILSCKGRGGLYLLPAI